MKVEKSGRMWFLFWAVVALALLTVPTLTGWASSTQKESGQAEQVAPLTSKRISPPDRMTILVHKMNKQEDQREEFIGVDVDVDVKVVVPGKYWIGIIVGPVESDLVKAQLGIDHGLVVGRVVSDSPAAKAGLEKHDILVKAGERQLESLKMLVESIEEAKETELELTIVRKSKQQTLKLVPAARPNDGQKIDVHIDTELLAERERIIKALRPTMSVAGKLEASWGKDGKEFVMVMPGLLLPGKQKEIPKNLEITVTKKGKGKATIRVKMDDDQWEAEWDTLDKLPENIRVHVQSLLSHGSNGHGTFEVEAGKMLDLSKFHPEQLQRWFKTAPGMQFDLQKMAPNAMKVITIKSVVKGDSESGDEVEVEVISDSEVEKVKQAIEQLKERLDQLRKEPAKLSPPNEDNAAGVEEAIEKQIDEMDKDQTEPTAPEQGDTGVLVSHYVFACV